MQLECAERIGATNATEADIRKALADDEGRGEYVILRMSRDHFIQAAGEYDNPQNLEYREGDADHHFECARKVNKAEVETVFLKYLKGDPTWKDDFEWKKLERKPWWKVW